MQTIKKNKILVKKYPWLKPKDCLGNEIVDYDYSFTWLDDMPEGWKIAFGEMMCEEIQQKLIEIDYADKYSVEQVKEKFGELRWYDNCSEISLIITKYSVLSRNICQYCGKPDTPISVGYWEWTCCEDCYKTLKHMVKPYDKEFDIADNKMQEEYKISRYNKNTDKWINTTFDISDTAEKIRRRYYEHEK